MEERKDYVRSTHSLGPKCAVQPKASAPKLLSYVRQVSSLAPDNEKEKCVSEGVDVLLRCGAPKMELPVKRVATYLKDRNLCLVQSDKEGGFGVFPYARFFEKAQEAISSVFHTCEQVSLPKVKREAKSPCKKLNLDSLTKQIENSAKVGLQMFFGAKTHKVDTPFLVIVSERQTWQKCVARFLQRNLNLLEMDDPFSTRNSEQVVDFLMQSSAVGFSAFSVDVKDLYYSLPRDLMLTCVDDAISAFGPVPFQN